jgi:hypothetical protein
MKSELFDHICKLNENFINFNDLNKETLKTVLTPKNIKILRNIKKDKWSDFLEAKGNTAFDYLKKQISDHKSAGFDIQEAYIIIDNKKLPVGYVNFMVVEFNGKKPFVYEIELAGFIYNSFTLVKDVILLIEEMLIKYEKVTWTVSNDNPIKKAYDKKVKDWGGKITKVNRSNTRYTLIKKNLINFHNKL